MDLHRHLTERQVQQVSGTKPASLGGFARQGAIEPTRCSGRSVYCPEGSAAPVQVRPGYYAVGGDPSGGATSEQPCPLGTYSDGSSNGGGKPELCPAGRAGTRTGLSSAMECELCEAGHYCPAGSSSTTQRTCQPALHGGEAALLAAGGQ